MRRLWIVGMALVVAVWAQPAHAQTIDSVTVTSANASCLAANCVEVATRGVASVGIDVSGSGTFTLVVEGTRNGGTTWRTVNVIDDSDQDALASSITAAGSFSLPNSGYTAVRVRASALSAGTPVVTVTRGILAPLDALGGGAGGGAGTEYTEAATDASITGTAAMMEVAGDALAPIQGTVADGLLVNLGTNNDVTVTGTVTANLSATDNAVLDDIADGIAVTGTVTANLSATDNAVLDDIADGIAVTATDLDVQSGGADILSTTAFNSAFGTAGTADTQVLSVQGIASGTALTVSATNLDVQIGGSDSLTIGTFPDNEPINVAQMNGVAVSMGVGASGTGTQRVAAIIHDGTDTALVDGSGNLQITGAVSCSNCTGSGASDVDDSSFTVGTDSVAPIGILVDETTPDSADEGDSALVRGSPNRNLYTQIRDGASGAERGVSVTAANELLVELGAGAASIGVLGANSGVDIGDVTINNATVAVTQSGTWDEVGINDSGNSITVDGTVTVTDGAGALNVICDSGCGSGTQYAEDAAHTTGDQTMFVSGIRRDTTPSSSAGTAGDYTAFNVDGNGRLYVQAVLYNSSGTELTLASDGTIGSAIGTAAPLGTAVYADFDGAAIPTIANVDTEGELVPVAASIKGIQYMMLVSEDGSLQYGTSTTPLVVDLGANNDVTVTSGTVTANLGATDNAVLDDIVDGTLQVQVSGSLLTAAELIDNIVGVEDAAETAGGGLAMAGSVRRDTAATSAGAAGDNATVNTDGLGRLWTRNGNPCADHARITTAAISTASSGNVEIVALNGSDLIYICGYSVVATAATAVQFIRGTGTACATGETDLTGAWSFAANGGITQANAGVPQFVVAAGNAFCIENSGANAIEGHVTYVRTASP